MLWRPTGNEDWACSAPPFHLQDVGITHHHVQSGHYTSCKHENITGYWIRDGNVLDILRVS